MRELRNDVFGADVIADAGGRGTAEIGRRGREAELLRVAAEVPIAPGHAAAATEIARVGGTQAHGMTRPLLHLEGDGDSPLAVRRVAEVHVDGGEDSERQQILTCLLDRECA